MELNFKRGELLGEPENCEHAYIETLGGSFLNHHMIRKNDGGSYVIHLNCPQKFYKHDEKDGFNEIYIPIVSVKELEELMKKAGFKKGTYKVGIIISGLILQFSRKSFSPADEEYFDQVFNGTIKRFYFEYKCLLHRKIEEY
jgi:hypothetical protein